MSNPVTAPPTVTLTDLIKAFIQYCVDNGKESFPSFLHFCKPWQIWLYRVHESQNGFPLLACIGEFDWDGQYPTCRNWHEVQSSFCITEFCISYGIDRCHMNKEMRMKENELALQHPKMFELMLAVAERVEGFFES